MELAPFWMRPKIAFFGSADGEEIAKLKVSANIMGQETAKRGGIVVTGACGGLPHEVALGAWKHRGLALGYSPASTLEEHVQEYSFPVHPYVLIFTGQGLKGRNVISCRTADAAIFIAGRRGTTNEYTIFADEGPTYRVIGALGGSGGAVDKYIIPDFENTAKPPRAKCISERGSKKLIELVFNDFNELLRQRKELA